jgi:uncharacterized protein (UPF0264 family)
MVLVGVGVMYKLSRPVPPVDSMPSTAAAAPVNVTAAPTADSPAMLAYRRAREHIASNHLREAVVALKEAIGHDPQFGEAWYQLGAAQANLAIGQVNANADAAVAMMEEAVRSKKHARNLMNAGELRVWTPAQTAQARSDLDNALADIDQVMGDRTSLIAAMEIWAGAR